MNKFLIAYPNIKDCTIQTFVDDKNNNKSPHPPTKMAINQKNLENAKLLNQRGHGIFFSVNSMSGTAERSIKHVSCVNAWIAEIDGMEKSLQQEKIRSCKIKPSMIIESKSSYHLYRFCEDGTIENWKKICNGLRNFLDSDPKVIDLARVLRVPGYNHVKNINDPFPVTYIGGTLKKHTEQEMLDAFPDVIPRAERKQKALASECKFYETKKDDSGFWERAKSLNSKQVLSELSGTHYVSGESFSFQKNAGGTEQICVNGKATSCWIDKNGKIGSTGGGGPHRTNRVFRYGVIDAKGLYQRLKDKHPELIVKNEKKEIDVPKLQKQEQKYYTWGLDCVNKNFGMPQLGDFVLLAGLPSVGKTEFMYSMARKNSKSEKVCYFSLELPEETMKMRLARSRAGVSKYEYQVKSYSQQQKIKIDEYKAELDTYKNLHFFTYDRVVTIDEILDKIIEESKRGCSLFYIDTLGNIGGSHNEIERLSDVSKKLRLAVNNLGVTIVGLHHMSKPSKKQEKGPGGMGAIRGTQKLIDDATIVMEIWRDIDPDLDGADESDRAEVTLVQYKDTYGGSTGNQKFYFVDGEYTDTFRGTIPDDDFIAPADPSVKKTTVDDLLNDDLFD